ncbi:MAG: DUF5054 domain-containing protein [Devosia sp.]|uniref:DUF5054 domain-containing protein n=1 Tax=Devosia sp. TaxID=1871048 RepID=UPI0024CB5363|nr:DUF5054 domain-containing protein [Devosia sp.]UYN98598.1 MAG: DUF5054 domain-containing protein [Devosia sp.]
MTQKTIHLVFKTHLDIGFTDHAANVVRQYHDQFIPQAISTGEHFYAENAQTPAFIWTTGAWLIWDHLNTQPAEKVRRLEQAIARGLIAWHGLPYTTHSELMSASLFRAGLSYSAELDRRFGKTTIAAKMTDVPGHTLGMVPLMAEAGLKFLHLGVNTASPVPDVPPIFRWQAPGGAEIVVMYQASYGATDFPAGDDIGLSFAHTNDNIGPQSVGQTVEALRHLHRAYPGAAIKASTLDAFGAQMWARRESFPVVTEEIGDSWIHGTATDPKKLAQYRALVRLQDGWAATPTPERLAFARDLAMVAEHTWGVDIKTYLRDEKAWDRMDFDAARRNDYRFAYAEQSWAEQRAYLARAMDNLAGPDRVDADSALAALDTHMTPVPATPSTGTQIGADGWSVDLDPITGDILRLTAPDARAVQGQDTALFAYRHESYDWQALQKHLDSYLQHRDEWAILDHDKPGLDTAKTARTASFAPQHLGVAENKAWSRMPADASAALGAPAGVSYALRALDARRLEVTLTLQNKAANRMPEAGFLSFTPAATGPWDLCKMGLWHDSGAVVRRGGGQLQAIEGARMGSLRIEPLDTMLVSPEGAPFMPFQPERPDFSAGLRFNLYNNKWGTNFPMWWEGNAAFRFVVELDAGR